ncbi:MAG TPA: hydroxymethylglutaryl-CoA reductase, degradative [Woeseiaceae bacterium]|nr:hydroxymethylglutaryl-CoA reductase, degradative [Woeseiaceae bacterium]
MKDSRIGGLYRMTVLERIDTLVARGWLDESAASRLRAGASGSEVADRMVENVIGVFGLPLAVAPNFAINGRDVVVPMVVEEPSVVAGVSSAAKLARAGGGFTATAADPVLVGQVQLVDVADAQAAAAALDAAAEELVARANALQPALVERGGGARGIETFGRRLPDGSACVVLHLLVDTRDAMGANLVNTMCEGLAPEVERLAGGRAALKILSNFADRSIVIATAAIPPAVLAGGGLSGEEVRDAIVRATALANVDRYRAVTHNKGVMNGIDAVAIATGNDWRAIEAAAHAWAAREGSYRSLTQWTVDGDGRLAGKLELPLKVGIVGGSLRANPAVETAFALLGVASAPELAQVMAAVGLAQNLAALRALVTHGIQKGHMRLHARSVAASVGSPPEHFERLVKKLVASGEIKVRKARQLLAELLADDRSAAGTDAGMPVHGTASGKVILLGEHAVVYGRHALALPIEHAVQVALEETRAPSRLELADAGAPLPREARITEHLRELLEFIQRRVDVADRHFALRVRSRIPTGMGLGSSAAVAVAIIRAFDRVLALALGDEAVNALAFECEKLAHGSPSGIDNTLATYGRPILFRKEAPGPPQTLELTEPAPLVVAAGGARGSTREQVAGVAVRFGRMPDRYNAIFDEMDAISIDGAKALAAGDYAVLGALMNLCHGLLNALEVSTPELERMVHIARSAGAAGAKLTGAGGGGSIVALCPGKMEAVQQALATAGYRIVSMAGA